jgi:aspartyl-tRNA(Asn)/glutamyl-tRNA(Gln) amidotransferase subunit B
VERAIGFEIERQRIAIEMGEPLVQETRGWDDDRGLTYRMRVKESSDDYRYFPEPDLPPLEVDPAWVEQVRAAMPELPGARRARYTDELRIAPADALTIVADPAATSLLDGALVAGPALPPRKLANWITGEYLRLAKGEGGTAAVAGVSGAELAALVGAVEAGELSATNAKEVFARHAASGEPVATIIASAGYRQISDADTLGAAVAAAIAANPAAVADIRAGRTQAVGFLVGQVMKQTRGQANAETVGRLVREALEVG